ncbi:MAG: hypothetical protein IJ302_06795 [Clostridia bacterium]|nr:hypothetical protein [Clostridia bacterium]
MKHIKLPLLILFCVCAVFFGTYLGITRQSAGRGAYPTLTVSGSNSVFTLSCFDDTSRLMEGVTALDAEDGDLTGSIVLESVSPFDAQYRRTVTYAVCDSDNHVVKAQRTISYSDYTPPRFSLTVPQRYTSLNLNSIVSTVQASDLVDGDLSQNIKIESYTLDSGALDTCAVTLSVTSSTGATSRIPLHVSLVSSLAGTPLVSLTEYITYLKTGDAFDAEAYITQISSGISTQMLPVSEAVIRGDVDVNTPGAYIVSYTAQNDAGTTGVTYLTVIVED